MSRLRRPPVALRCWRRVTSTGVEHGAAPVEFAMVMLVLLPLFATIFQFGLFLYVRNTLTACAHEAARVESSYQAPDNSGDTAGEQCAYAVVSRDLVDDVDVQPGADGLVVATIEARMPGLGWLGAFPFTVTGRSVQEPGPA
jgi:TadE-like protein